MTIAAQYMNPQNGALLPLGSSNPTASLLPGISVDTSLSNPSAAYQPIDPAYQAQQNAAATDLARAAGGTDVNQAILGVMSPEVSAAVTAAQAAATGQPTQVVTQLGADQVNGALSTAAGNFVSAAGYSKAAPVVSIGVQLGTSWFNVGGALLAPLANGSQTNGSQTTSTAPFPGTAPGPPWTW